MSSLMTGYDQILTQLAADDSIAPPVPKEVWERNQGTITELYNDSPMTLEEIREHMRQTHLFDASLKQWKGQLKTWKLGRYLKKGYASHIIRLHREAVDQGVNRQVYLYGRKKTRKDINLYLRKSNPRRTEADLLRESPGTGPLPSCITYVDTPLVLLPLLEARPHRGSNASTPSSRPSSSVSRPNMDSSPLIEASTGGTSRTSLESGPDRWSIVEKPDIPDMTPFQDMQTLAVGEDEHVDIDFDEDFSPAAFLRDRLQYLESHFQTLAINASEVGPMNALSLVQPLLSPATYQTQQTSMACSPYFHNAISVTPTEQLLKPSIEHMNYSLPDALRTILFEKHEWGPLRSKTHQATFLLYCIQACIQHNQESLDAENAAIEGAAVEYMAILRDEFDDCLSTLSGLVALLESYGQRKVTRNILVRIAKVLLSQSQNSFGLEMDPLYETVKFMCDAQAPEYGASATYDTPHLREIDQLLSRKHGNASKLALIARYNVAWAELEHKNFQLARDSLLLLKPLTERVFDRYHLQSISCTATLARAHLRLGEYANAITLIEESVVPRIERVFSKSHIYYWEARYRQGYFLNLASDEEIDPAVQAKLRQEAESILRDVLLWRLTILGSNNPRTSFTFRALKEVLIKQDKLIDAADLHNWCFEQCQPERQLLQVREFGFTHREQ